MVDLLKADIVIVNWNSGSQLQTVVESIRTHGRGHVGQCIVVDNGSTDHSAGFLAGSQDVELIETGKNLGFSKACNLGAARGTSPYVLFLNPDAVLAPESLSIPLTFLSNELNKQVGIAGIALKNAHGSVDRSCSFAPSPVRLISRSLGIDRFIPQIGMRMSEWDHSESRVVDQVIGAFFCVRRTLFEQLEGFDERFFVYFEEVDFSRRAANAGYISYFLRNAEAFHEGGGVSSQVKAHRLFYSLRSRLQYAFKHFSSLSALGVGFATLCVEPFTRLAYLILMRRWQEIGDLWRGFGMLWGWTLHSLITRPYRSKRQTGA
jgi:GT2 family glycosyltransferase